MKITRERLEEILREEIATVKEGHMGGDVPLSVLAAGGEEARKAVMAAYEQGSREFELAMMVIDMVENQGMIAEGMGETLVTAIREIIEAAKEEFTEMHEAGSEEYKAAMETLRQEVKLALGKDDLQENMFSNLKTSIDKVLRPGKYEDRKGTAFTAKRFNKALELLAEAQQIIKEFEPPLANKIDVVRGEVLKMRNQMLNEGELKETLHQEAPPIENDQRARELLDGFKNMLKPQERAEPSACATFLRQLADMVEREGGIPDAGTMPKPLPNN